MSVNVSKHMPLEHLGSVHLSGLADGPSPDGVLIPFQFPGITLPEVKARDVRLLSIWATVASVIALTALWRLVHSCFYLGVLARSPKLGRVKLPDGRSPTVVAAHFTSVVNAVVCLAAYAPATWERIAADGWSLGALFPSWSRPLAIGPAVPGTNAFYLSLAAYCLHACLVDAERVVHGASTEQTALIQRMLLFVVVVFVCMVDFVPEVSLALLLLEVPSPFVALSQALQDFRASSDPHFGVASGAAVFCILKLRFIVFGACLCCALCHQDRQKLETSLPREFMLTLCCTLLCFYIQEFYRVWRDMRRASQDVKQV